MRKMDKKEYLYILLIALLCTIFYSNTFKNEFVFDDLSLIINNYDIRSFSNIPNFFTTPSHANLYRPVRSILYTLTYSIWGLNTFGYHLNSLIFHILNTTMVYFIASSLLKNKKLGFIASLIFALHPIHTERITNMSAGFDQFGILMYLISFYLYILHSQHPKKSYLIASIFAFAVGIFSSEELVTLPVILFLYNLCFNKTNLKEKIKFYVPYVLIGIIFFLIRLKVIGKIGRAMDYFTGSLYSNIITTIPIILKYIKLLIMPYPLSLEYTPVLYYSILNPVVLISLFALIAIIYFTVKSKSHIIIFSVFFFFITLMPFLNLIPLYTLMAERYLYIPSIAFCILAALLFGKLSDLNARKIKAIVLIILILILISFSYITLKRNSDWKNSMTLFTKGVETAPKSTRAHDNLGFAYQEEKQYDKALEQYKIAIELEPENYWAHGNLGTTYAELGKYDLAIQELQTAILLNPEYYKALTNLGLAYYKTKDYESALKYLKKAVEMHPGFSKSHNDLGIVYAQTGDYESAIKEFQKAIKIYKGYKDAHYNLGVVYVKINQTELAKKEFELAKMS